MCFVIESGTYDKSCFQYLFIDEFVISNVYCLFRYTLTIHTIEQSC